MKETAKIICTKDDGQLRCEWRGGLFALVSGDVVEEFGWEGKRCKPTFEMGGLTLRVVELKPGPGVYYDQFFVMREGFLARFVKRYNDFLRWGLQPYTLRIDKTIYRLIGRPLREGQYIPKASLSNLIYRLRV